MANPEIIHYSPGAVPLLPLSVDSGFVSDLKRPRKLPEQISAAVLSTLAVFAPVVEAVVVVPVAAQEIRTPEVDVPPRPENTVQNLSCFYSVAGSFENSPFPNQTDEFIATFKATPGATNEDGTINLSDGTTSSQADSACLIRFDPDVNRITVRNNTDFLFDATALYNAGVELSFLVHVNVKAHTYSVNVDGVQVATNFAFRDGQQAITQLNNWVRRTAGGDVTFEVCDFLITPVISPAILYSEVRIPPVERTARSVDQATPFVEVVAPVVVPASQDVRTPAPELASRSVDQITPLAPALPVFSPEIRRPAEEKPPRPQAPALIVVPFDEAVVAALSQPVGPRVEPPPARPVDSPAVFVAAPEVVVFGQEEIRRPQEERGPPLIDSPTIVAPFDEAKIPVDQGQVRRPPVPQAARPVSELAIVVAPFDAAEAPITQGLIRRPEVVRAARPADVPAIVFDLFDVPVGQGLIRRPEVVRPARPTDVPAIFVAAVFDAGGALQGDVRRPAVEPVARPFDQVPVQEVEIIDPAIAGAIAQIQLILGVPEHRPPYALLFDNSSASFPSVVQTTEETINTFFAAYVGIPGTKYRVRARQIEGGASLATVALRSSIRARFYPRTVLLAANATVSPDVDTYLVGFVGSQDFNTETSVILQQAMSSFASFEKRSHICLQFNVASFAGVIWKSAKVQLWRATDSNSNGGAMPKLNIARCVRTWDLTQATWNVFKGASPGPDTWTQGGARNVVTDHDSTTDVAWTPPAVAVGSMVTTPDITGIVNQAIALDAGTLRLLFVYPGAETGGGFPGVHYHSIESLSAALRPVLFFEAL